MKKIITIFGYAFPVLCMITLVPLIQNDYVLTVLCVAIIMVTLSLIRSTRTDYIVLVFGFCIMIVFEYIFIQTGVEKFIRNSLFGIMPLWLPFIWSYGFVAIKRSAVVLDSQ